MSRDYVLQSFQKPVDLQIDYARELNPQQLAAVTAPPGPSLVIAGAGSGKTRTLTYRVAFLIEQGIAPDRILLLTFTNKAAREMMRRVGDLLGGDLSQLWGGTFHSIGNRILRLHCSLLGLTRDFSILDREDAKDLLAACIDDAKIDPKETRFPKAEVLGDIFSMSLNTGRSVAETLAQSYDHFSGLAPQIEDLRQRYTKRKLAANGVDFDDLLTLWLRLLKEHPEIRVHYQRRFQFVLVDEYQDTNTLQGELIDLLAARHRHLMVVGDDAQSIYAWRGANYQNIMKFPDRYPGAQVHKIETNYRSTPEILAVANAAIASNLNQFPKELVAARPSSMKPALIPCGDGNEQATFIAQRALELRDEGVNLNDVAVLYRSHFHALELQFELTRRNIPFTITSGIRFFEQAHIKDVAAFLRLVANPQDELAFKRLAKMLPGIGGRGAEKLWDAFYREVSKVRSSTSVVAAAGAPVYDPQSLDIQDRAGAETGAPRLATGLSRISKMVPKKAAIAWAQFAATMAQLEAPDIRQKPGRMIVLIVEAMYEDHLKEEFADYRRRLEDVQQLAEFAVRFETLDELLSQLALMTNVEAEDSSASNDKEQLKLSTVHQAKGLEFDVVFVMMLCDGMFPSGRSAESPDGEEEERRLFYVAITRAKNELYLTYPLIRMTAGMKGDIFQQPSRFLGEIPKELLEEWNLRPHGAAYGGFTPRKDDGYQSDPDEPADEDVPF
jgi:DNA helicase-2/ATP-dependent DNA helicase PcrA